MYGQGQAYSRPRHVERFRCSLRRRPWRQSSRPASHRWLGGVPWPVCARTGQSAVPARSWCLVRRCKPQAVVPSLASCCPPTQPRQRPLTTTTCNNHRHQTTPTHPCRPPVCQLNIHSAIHNLVENTSRTKSSVLGLEALLALKLLSSNTYQGAHGGAARRWNRERRGREQCRGTALTAKRLVGRPTVTDEDCAWESDVSCY